MTIFGKRFTFFGNHGIISRKGGYAMTEAEKRQLLSFMRVRCSCSESGMGSWLQSKEFMDALLINMKDRELYVDDNVVLSIMERLWPDMDSGKIACPSFKNCKRAMNQLRRAVEEQSKQPVP